MPDSQPLPQQPVDDGELGSEDVELENLIKQDNVKKRLHHIIIVNSHTSPDQRLDDNEESLFKEKKGVKEIGGLTRQDSVGMRLRHIIVRRETASDPEHNSDTPHGSLSHDTQRDILKVGPAAITFTVLMILGLFCIIVGTILYYWQIIEFESTCRYFGYFGGLFWDYRSFRNDNSQFPEHIPMITRRQRIG